MSAPPLLVVGVAGGRLLAVRMLGRNVEMLRRCQVVLLRAVHTLKLKLNDAQCGASAAARLLDVHRQPFRVLTNRLVVADVRLQVVLLLLLLLICRGPVTTGHHKGHRSIDKRTGGPAAGTAAAGLFG